jgi:hypothetical protein
LKYIATIGIIFHYYNKAFDCYVINEIGSFDGSKAVGVKAGVYLLDISADGNWNIQINQ